MPGPTVSIQQGSLQGKISKNILGDTFYSFQGIPYAKPPTGELRFKSPLPPEPWMGILDATKEANVCYSRDMFTKAVVGSEDCLFLNVYTKNLPKNTLTSLQPVMVWIHGGSLRQGSGNTDLYGPEYLLKEDIVLVTINYRLGILGFLSFEDTSLGVLGNAGLKDMVMALKWVQKNIRNFAGDSNNVTIFGESSGAGAVHYLVLSPKTKGLFHRAIMQSGCALNVFVGGKNQPLSQLSAKLGLSTTNEQVIFDQIRNLPVETLFEISEEYVKFCDIYNNFGDRRPYAPVIEKPSEEALIIEDPMKTLCSGNYNKIPLIFGYNNREAMFVQTMIKPRKPRMPDNFETIIPFTLNVKRGSKTSREIADKIKNFYYGELGSEDNIENFYSLYTDHFTRDIIYAAQVHALTSPAPVFLYRMSVETKLNIFKRLGKIKESGVAHGDDIGYLFKTKFSPELEPESLEYISVKRFVKYWTNFAKYGNPNSHDIENDKDIVKWKPVTRNLLNFIDIGKELKEGINPESNSMRFWNTIFNVSHHL